LLEDLIHQGGFAVVDMGDNGHIPDLHESFFQRKGLATMEFFRGTSTKVIRRKDNQTWRKSQLCGKTVSQKSLGKPESGLTRRSI